MIDIYIFEARPYETKEPAFDMKKISNKVSFPNFTKTYIRSIIKENIVIADENFQKSLAEEISKNEGIFDFIEPLKKLNAIIKAKIISNDRIDVYVYVGVL